MTKRTKIGFVVLAIGLLLIAVNIINAGMVWECSGDCYGCELWNCNPDITNECNACCNYSGGTTCCERWVLCQVIEN